MKKKERKNFKSKYTLPEVGKVKGLSEVLNIIDADIPSRVRVIYRCTVCLNEKSCSRYSWISSKFKRCRTCTGVYANRSTPLCPRSATSSLAKEYRVWVNMYKNAQLKKLPLNIRWKRSFENFLKDVGVCPTPSSSYRFVRNDPKKGYVPSNCFWKRLKNK